MKTIIITVAAVALLVTANNAVKSEKLHNVSPDIKIEAMENQVKSDTLIVEGKCGMCKNRIEKAAKSVKGVSTASWDIKTKQLKLDYDPSLTSVEAVSKVIVKVGHDTEKDKASQVAYNALPSCCKYRDE